MAQKGRQKGMHMAENKSRKPDWVHDVVEKRFPEAAKAELFARAPRNGWVSIGNQIDKFSEGEAA